MHFGWPITEIFSFKEGSRFIAATVVVMRQAIFLASKQMLQQIIATAVACAQLCYVSYSLFYICKEGEFEVIYSEILGFKWI